MAKRTSSTPKTSSKKTTAPASSAAVPPTVTPAPAPVVAAPVATPKAVKSTVTHQMIANKAFEIWERKGRPIGKDLENWQDAERELGVR